MWIQSRPAARLTGFECNFHLPLGCVCETDTKIHPFLLLHFHGSASPGREGHVPRSVRSCQTFVFWQGLASAISLLHMCAILLVADTYYFEVAVERIEFLNLPLGPCRHLYCCKDIVLRRSTSGSLGFSIVGGQEEVNCNQSFFIRSIVEGTPAYNDGRIRYACISLLTAHPCTESTTIF